MAAGKRENMNKNPLTIYSYLVHMFLFCSLCRIGSTMDWKMDWDLAIKRNSEALNGIVAALFAMLGLDGDARFRGFRHACLPGRAARSAARRIRRAAPHCHRGTGPCGEGGPSRPMPKGQSRSGRATEAGFPPSSSTIRGKISRSCASAGSNTRKHPPRILFFGPGSRWTLVAGARAHCCSRPPP